MAVFVVRKKAGDRFVDKSSRVQKWQMFSESDRRGIEWVEFGWNQIRIIWFLFYVYLLNLENQGHKTTLIDINEEVMSSSYSRSSRLNEADYI